LENSGFEDLKAKYKQIGGILHKLKNNQRMVIEGRRP